jgi:arylsulfatase A-like enzyme
LLYLHLMDVHQYVYDEESALFGTTYSDIYDNAIRRTDRHIGALVDALEALGLRDRTIFVVASDHGEAFGEHGSEGHAKDLYVEVTRTPWIVSLPFRLEPGIVIERPTENVDVWPTLLDLLGFAPPDGVDGHSRVADIAGAVEEGKGGAPPLSFAQLDRNWGQTHKRPRPLVAIGEDSFRFYYDAGHADRVELYDLNADPASRRTSPTPIRIAHNASHVKRRNTSRQNPFRRDRARRRSRSTTCSCNSCALWATRSTDRE